MLGNKDERFKNFANDLFSHKSREIDRELLSKEENAKIDASISSYLRLLSGYLQFRASLETLEYLIRRYKYVFFLLVSLSFDLALYVFV